MISRDDYIRMSLGLDLFFLRIMKEHSFFLEAAFTPKNPNLAQTADSYKRQFEMLLDQAALLSVGVLGNDELASGQFITPYTLKAEGATQYYTSIPIDSALTLREQGIAPGSGMSLPASLEGKVSDLNQRAITAATSLAGFKARLLSDILSCRLFMNTYPLLIDHILREANLFAGMLTKLQNREDMRTPAELLNQEIFWNRIMAEHAKFIRGLLDPTEAVLFDKANMFGNEFDQLTAEAKQAQGNPALLPKVTADSRKAAGDIKDFKAAGAAGILDCKIRSMILPLLADHVLREANHFIFLLDNGM